MAESLGLLVGSAIGGSLYVQSGPPSPFVARAAWPEVGQFLGEVWINEKGLAAPASANPSSFMVAGGRFVPTATTAAPLEFRVRALF